MPDDNRSRLKEWLASGAARLEPLTFSQRELWEASPVPPADPSNHICVFMKVTGNFTSAQATSAMQLVVDRHEAMRTSILPGKNGALQLIRAKAEPNMAISELASAESLEERMQEIFDTPFDLVRGPLYRIHVFRTAPNESVMVMAIHHAIADGWTLGVYVENLAEAFLHVVRKLPGHLPALPLSYAAWDASERAAWTPARLAEAAAWWKARLANAPKVWPDRTEHSVRMERVVSTVAPDLTGAIRDLARRCNATLFSTLLTGFQLTMARWTGSNDLVVGTPIANRTKRDIRASMGYCSGVVPLRGTVDPELSVEESVRATHEMTVESFANAMPFAELVGALDDRPTPTHNPIFDVRFALQNHPIPDSFASGFSVDLAMRSTGTARFELGCELTEEDDGLELVWLYKSPRLDHAKIAELERIFIETLDAMRADTASATR